MANALSDVWDGLRGVFEPIDAGTWPDWVAAIGTSAAFIIAAIAYRKSVQDGRVAQARLVFSKSTFKVYEEGDDLSDFRGADYGKVTGIWPNRSADGVWQVAMKNCVVVEATVHNASNGLISNVEVEVLSHSDRYEFPGRYVYNFDVVDPASSRSTRIVFPTPTEFSWNDLLTQVTFTDAAGKHWVRRHAGPVRAARDDNRQWPVVGVTLVGEQD